MMVLSYSGKATETILFQIKPILHALYEAMSRYGARTLFKGLGGMDVDNGRKCDFEQYKVYEQLDLPPSFSAVDLKRSLSHDE
jgi:hypothetical protein